MLLSADDRAEALLGYSDAPVTADTPIPPQFKGQMAFYAAEIEALRSGNVHAVAPAQTGDADASDFAPIAPMLTTKWSQDAPFNAKTPLVEGHATLTGCGATALAQVLNYFVGLSCSLKMYDPRSINMADVPGAAAVVANGGIMLDGGTSTEVDPNGFDVSIDITCEDGYYGYGVGFNIFTKEDDAYVLRDYLATAPLCLPMGASARASVHFSLPAEIYANETTLYTAAYELFGGKMLDEIKPFTLKGAGISTTIAGGDDLENGYNKAIGRLTATSAAEGVAMQIYSIDGKAVSLTAEAASGGVAADVSQLPAGVYVVVATDASGARATAKIVR